MICEKLSIVVSIGSFSFTMKAQSQCSCMNHACMSECMSIRDANLYEQVAR